MDKLSEVAIGCGLEGCAHTVLGTWAGSAYSKTGGAEIWAEAMRNLLESEEWPNLGSMNWNCSNCLSL